VTTIAVTKLGPLKRGQPRRKEKYLIQSMEHLREILSGKQYQIQKRMEYKLHHHSMPLLVQIYAIIAWASSTTWVPVKGKLGATTLNRELEHQLERDSPIPLLQDTKFAISLKNNPTWNRTKEREKLV
jgi:hypothetical protein